MFVESNVRFQSLEQLSDFIKMYKRVGYGAIIITFDSELFLSTLKQNQSKQGTTSSPQGRGRQDRKKTTEEKDKAQVPDLELDTPIETNPISKENEPEQDNQLDSGTLHQETFGFEAQEDEFDKKDSKYLQARKGLFGIEGLLNRFAYKIDPALEDKEIFQQIQKLCQEVKIPFALRVNVDSNNVEQMKKELAKIDRYSVLVSVTTTNKECLILASKDGRVDILSLVNSQQVEAMFKGAVSQCYQSKKSIEIGLEQLILEKHQNRAKLMRTYAKLFNILRIPRDKVIISNSNSSLFGIRGPKEIIALVNTLFNVPEKNAKLMVRENQEEILAKYYLLVTGQIGEMGVKFFTGEPPQEEYENPKKTKEIKRQKDEEER